MKINSRNGDRRQSVRRPGGTGRMATAEAQRSIDADQTATDAVQTAADAEQTADAEPTIVDAEQTAVDADQTAPTLVWESASGLPSSPSVTPSTT